jgi:hypothetical protein
MSRTIRNTLIGVTVAFFVGVGLRLLPVLLHAPDLELAASATTLPLMLGMLTIFILNGEDTRRRALAFEAPSPAHAALCFVRTGLTGKGAGMNVSIDGRGVAQLQSSRFTRVEVAPGSHDIGASFGGSVALKTKPAQLNVTAKAGEIVVVHLRPAGAPDGRVKIETMDREAIREKLPKMQMIAPIMNPHTSMTNMN